MNAWPAEMFNSNKPKPLKGHKPSFFKDFWLFGTSGLQGGELCQFEVTKLSGLGKAIWCAVQQFWALSASALSCGHVRLLTCQTLLSLRSCSGFL
jgi:hypothetical protein